MPDARACRRNGNMDTSVTGAAVAVRPACAPADAAIQRVLRAAYAQYATVLPSAVFDAYLADVLDIRSRLSAAEQLVAVHAGRVVGTVSFYPSAGDDGHGWPAVWAAVRGLGVHAAARGLGIGRSLVAACRDRATDAGAPVLALHTAAFMSSAVGVYERLGFHRAPRYDFDGVADLGVVGTAPVRVLAYRLDLTPPAQLPFP